MNVAEIISAGAVDLDCGEATKDSALRHMAALLHRDGAIGSVEEFVNDVYAREAEGITGIGEGIAIPHGKSPAVLRNTIAVCRLSKPIAWESVDGEPVSLIVLFAVMQDAPAAAHLKMMAGIARALANPAVCEAIKAARTPDELLRAFAGDGAPV